MQENRSPTMRQRRICEYLGLACTHMRSILCLSPTIRHRIYLEAGLVNDSDIDLNRWREIDVRDLTDDMRFSYNLLLTCRTIHAEASLILYSTNRFFVRYKDSRGLRLLRNLTQDALSSLAHLTVHLNATSCEMGEPCCKLYPRKSPRKFRSCRQHDKPLVSPSRLTRAIVREWQSTASHILAYIKPFTLQLRLVCDVEGLETAMQVVEPLLSTRTLASCAIRLGRQPDHPMQDLAYNTAIQAIGHPLDRLESPFRFFDLPQELRRQILEYTDLITPLCEVEWNPEDGFYVRYSTWRCGGIGDCYPHLRHACQFRNCWEYSNSGCFCRRSHAAFSSQCHCWSPPTSLFLVCRTLLADAQAIFFMKNRFVITPSKWCIHPAESTPIRLEVSNFLTDVVPCSALSHLRFLEVVLPLLKEDYLLLYEPAYQEWLRTIDYVRGQLCLSSLTMRVYIGYGGFLDRAGPSKERAVTVWDIYARTLGPISKLSGLKRFFVHIALPFASRQLEHQRRREKSESLEQWLRALEQKYEWLVMGSEYDSTSILNGKPETSQWLEPFFDEWAVPALRSAGSRHLGYQRPRWAPDVPQR